MPHTDLDPGISTRSVNARSVGIIAVLVSGLLSGAVSTGYITVFTIFMLGSLALNLARKQFIEVLRKAPNSFLIENLADVLGIFVIVQMTGGSGSIFQMLYIFPVIYVVMVRGVRTGLAVAGVASLMALVSGVLTPVSAVNGSGALAGRVPSSTAALILALFGTSIFSGYFAEELLRQRRKLQRLNDRLTMRSTELQRGKEKLEAFNQEVRKARDGLDASNRQLTQALSRLAAQEKKVSAVISSVASGIFLVDRTQKIEMWNQAAEEIMGYTASEVIDKPCGEVLRAIDSEDQLECSDHCEIFHMAGHRKRKRSYDLHVINKAGHRLWINISASPVYDDSGDTIGIVHVFTNVTAEHQDRAVLRKQAITDELTELFNRRFLQARLNEEMERAKRYSQPIALLMADIDHFKRINDEHGHPAGDAVLRELAALFRKNLRRSDFIARYGGEEFIIILPNVKEQDPIEVAEKIRQSVAQHHFSFDGKTLTMTISLGVVVYAGEDVSASEFMKFADNALYMAKRSGRNKVVSLPAKAS